MSVQHPARLLGASILIAASCWSVGATAQDSFVSVRSGRWDDAGTWRLLAGTDEDGIPDDDAVQIAAGHQVEVTSDAVAHARGLNLYGELDVTGDAPATLRVRSIYVRGTGHLRVEGPHTIVFEGGTPTDRSSFLETRGAGRTTLRGQLLTEDGLCRAVVAETASTLELMADGLEPDVLIGARWKFTSGRARLRTFEVVANTEDRVHLVAVEEGGPRLDAFEADASASGMMLTRPTCWHPPPRAKPGGGMRLSRPRGSSTRSCSRFGSVSSSHRSGPAHGPARRAAEPTGWPVPARRLPARRMDLPRRLPRLR